MTISCLAEQLDSGAGLEAQRRAIRDECHRRGWRLADIYEDAASGRALTGRSGLKTAGECLILVVDGA